MSELLVRAEIRCPRSRALFLRKCTCMQFESYLKSSTLHLAAFLAKCAYFSSAYLRRDDCMSFRLLQSCLFVLECDCMDVVRVCIVSGCLCDVFEANWKANIPPVRTNCADQQRISTKIFTFKRKAPCSCYDRIT